MEEKKMYFPEGCVVGRFVKRYKRFFVEVLLRGESVCAHTNNTGSMLGLLRPGAPVLLSPAKNQNRKLAWTLELIWTGGVYPQERELESFPEKTGGSTPFIWGQGFWVGVNTLAPNRLFEKAFWSGRFSWAKGYSVYRKEAKIGASRIDALLEGQGLPRLWVECKNVTLVEDKVAFFPDAVSERGVKHLEELTSIVESGERAAMFFCAQRPDGFLFEPADFIDPPYARAFWSALERGVEMYSYRAEITTEALWVGERIPVARA